ncbi:N-acetyltransferase [Haliscomenobacter sp.]|uniref:GNAT family N-acetyltransferase n=1 Tax=Haliscomenobacter sp. TaxID=2717303 RepID=UPI003364F8B4
MHPLKITPFKREDFEEYQSWFADPELNKHLGPMEIEDSWLEHVLNNNPEGCEYSVFIDQKMVAEVGILLPNSDNPSFYITNLAVHPKLRNQGIGSVVLSELMQMHPLKVGQSWKAFVDAENLKAIAFLEKNGWKRLSKIPDESNMYDFEFVPSLD